MIKKIELNGVSYTIERTKCGHYYVTIGDEKKWKTIKLRLGVW